MKKEYMGSNNDKSYQLNARSAPYRAGEMGKAIKDVNYGSCCEGSGVGGMGSVPAPKYGVFGEVKSVTYGHKEVGSKI